MAFQKRTNKFGRSYYEYDPDTPTEFGPPVFVLPVILDKSDFVYVKHTNETK